MVSPSEMKDILHAPYPESTRANLWCASLDMLKDLYRRNPDHPKVHEAQLAMEAALAEWNDEDIADFLLNYLFEPPVSTDLQSRSPIELREILWSIYRYLFEHAKDQP